MKTLIASCHYEVIVPSTKGLTRRGSDTIDGLLWLILYVHSNLSSYLESEFELASTPHIQTQICIYIYIYI